MLLLEKWISITLYPPISRLLISAGASDAEFDARFRALAGAGLLLACLLFLLFSKPTGRRVVDQLRPYRWAVGVASALAAIGGAYAMLWVIAALLGAGLRFTMPGVTEVLPWVLGGQALRALAEEIYYRGLLQSEMERLAPRLGAARPTTRRCVALLPMSILFAMEHVSTGVPGGDVLRQAAFTVSLGLLLGILVMLTRNLVLAACVHTWINWLLLGAAPMLSDPAGTPAIPSGTYIGVAVALIFVVAFFMQPRADQRTAG
jgi:membrane protease YdiL (CAAX protease family)